MSSGVALLRLLKSAEAAIFDFKSRGNWEGGCRKCDHKSGHKLKNNTTTTKYKSKQTKKREFQGEGKVCITLLRSAVT